jgi:hypothetical protein
MFSPAKINAFDLITYATNVAILEHKIKRQESILEAYVVKLEYIELQHSFISEQAQLVHQLKKSIDNQKSDSKNDTAIIEHNKNLLALVEKKLLSTREWLISESKQVTEQLILVAKRKVATQVSVDEMKKIITSLVPADSKIMGSILTIFSLKNQINAVQKDLIKLKVKLAKGEKLIHFLNDHLQDGETLGNVDYKSTTEQLSMHHLEQAQSQNITLLEETLQHLKQNLEKELARFDNIENGNEIQSHIQKGFKRIELSNAEDELEILRTNLEAIKATLNYTEKEQAKFTEGSGEATASPGIDDLTQQVKYLNDEIKKRDAEIERLKKELGEEATSKMDMSAGDFKRSLHS